MLPSQSPIYHLPIIEFLSAADLRCLEDYEYHVEQNSQDGSEHNRRNSTWEEERNIEREDTVGQANISANAADQDDRADGELFRVEEIDLL